MFKEGSGVPRGHGEVGQLQARSRLPFRQLHSALICLVLTPAASPGSFMLLKTHWKVLET